MISLSDFRIRHPEFANVPDLHVQTALDDAALNFDEDLWKDRLNHGHALLAAHLLCLSPWGQAAKLIQKDGTTTYFLRYQGLVYQVACGAAHLL